MWLGGTLCQHGRRMQVVGVERWGFAGCAVGDRGCCRWGGGGLVAGSTSYVLTTKLRIDLRSLNTFKYLKSTYGS